MRFVRRYEVTRLHDKVTIPSHRNVLLFVRGDRPAGRVVEGDGGHEPAIEEALLGAGAFGGNYFGHYYAALSGACFATRQRRKVMSDTSETAPPSPEKGGGSIGR